MGISNNFTAYEFRIAFLYAAVLLLISSMVSYTGIELGKKFVLPGQGYPAPGEIERDLYRFDAHYYYAIANTGYSYSGKPNSSPNLVFAPMFPLLTWAVSQATGIDLISAGFALNKVLFFLALTFLVLLLRREIGQTAAFIVLLALVTAAGSYSLHAFYSESVMLFFLSLCLLSRYQEWWWLMALSAAGLGASRLAALPLVAVIAADFVYRAWGEPKTTRLVQMLLLALVSIGGTAAYLLFLHWNFGNPLVLLPQIQMASWGKFHQELAWSSLLSGQYLWIYWSQAWERGLFAIPDPLSGLDIKALNLLWTTLAAISVIYMILRGPRHFWTYLFSSYFLFIYTTSASSDYLISAHRFFVFMVPVYLMFHPLHDWIDRRLWRGAARTCTAIFLLINMAFGLLHTAFFNQGIWYFF